jgi:hypothetical protein
VTRRISVAAVAVFLGAASRGAIAQDVLLPPTGWGFVPVIAAWHFSTPIPQSSGSVSDVAQVAVPFRVRVTAGPGWSFDLTGAYAVGAVHIAKTDTSGDQVLTLSGPTDLKFRVTGPLAGDALSVTAGLNLPTGITKLSSDQTSVLEAMSAPALHMPVAAYGTGTGGTLGLVSAMQRGDWALAFGASVEQRTEYTPIALALSSGTSETSVTPGTAVHITAGADRVVGEGRLSLLVVADAYAKDQVAISTNGAAAGTTSYTLGPQITAISRFDFGASGWRESGVDLAVRYRSAYSDADGNRVSGSDGTYLEGSIGGVLGGATGAGFVIGADARWHSGLAFTNTLVGMATTAAGITIGFEKPAGGGMFRFALHPQYGTFSTGQISTSGFGGMISGSFSARRGAP